MLVFGMGLYELFVSTLDIAKSVSGEGNQQKSNLFGLFTLKVSIVLHIGNFYFLMIQVPFTQSQFVGTKI